MNTVVGEIKLMLGYVYYIIPHIPFDLLLIILQYE